MTEPSTQAARDRWIIQGREVRLPVVVRQASTLAAMFWAQSAEVQRLVPDALCVPEVVPGRTLVTLAFIDYVDNDLGDYNEVSVTFFVQRREERPGRWFSLPAGLAKGTVESYIHRLPVNQGFTCEAGQTIWGFPKTVDELEFRTEGDVRVCSWSKDGRRVLRFRARTGGTSSYADRAMASWSRRHGVVYRTPFTSSGEGVGYSFRGARLELGDHEIADELRTLGLGRRPVMVNWTARMSGAFGPPTKL